MATPAPDGETALSAAKSALVAIVADYRVYLRAARQVALVEGSDTVSVVIGTFAPVNTKLEARIAAAAKGKDTTAASAVFAAMNTALATASADASRLPTTATLLAYTPHQYDTDPSVESTLNAVRTALDEVRTQLLDARADARTVLADLR